MTEKIFIFKMKKFRVGKFKMIYAGSTIFDFPTLDFLVWKIKQLEIIFNFPTLCSQGKKYCGTLPSL